MRKYNNLSLSVKDWTTQKLKKEHRILDRMIYEVDCYGPKDMIRFFEVNDELGARGIIL